MTPSVEETQFSECGRYRYTLKRNSLIGSDRVCFVMLNPSTADATLDDPTTRRAIAFAQRFDCREYLAVNLFALRSTDPKGLKDVDDPVGPQNDEYLLAAADWADEMIVAWGAGGAYKCRNEHVLDLLSHRQLWCLGRTKDGHPRFPLYLRRDAQLEVFRNPDEKEQPKEKTI